MSSSATPCFRALGSTTGSIASQCSLALGGRDAFTFHSLVVQGGFVTKTLAVRLEDDLHAQLCVLAQLSELTVTDAIRQAIEQWIEQKRSAPELTTRAKSVLDEIEREADQRRLAIATLLGETAEPGAKTTRERATKLASSPAWQERWACSRQLNKPSLTGINPSSLVTTKVITNDSLRLPLPIYSDTISAGAN